MIRQRLRGVLGVTITACIPWTALGLLIGAVLRLGLIPGWQLLGGRPIGVVGVFTVAGAIVGIINGLTFSGVVLAAERGRSVADLRGWRFALWGALATGATLGLIFRFLFFPILQSLVGATIGGVVGGLAGIVALATARRSGVSITQKPSVEP